MPEQVIVGIDVGAESLDVSAEVGGEEFAIERFANDAAGHSKLSRWLKQRGKSARVVVESTGVYSFDLALALHQCEHAEVMVANPRSIKDFARASMRRSKSDAQDAVSIREYAKRMEFVPWQPPPRAVLELRTITRRIAALTVERTRELNRKHAVESSEGASRVVLEDIQENLAHLERRLSVLTKEAVRVIESEEGLARAYHRLTSVKGIAATSGVAILSELLALPRDMTVRQWVAHCGLDPREYQSGSSVKKPARISKVGNVHLRRALYMPALVASQYEPQVKAYYEKLLKRGKKPRQALVAIMRKLVHAIYGMLRTDTDLDGKKFYALG